MAPAARCGTRRERAGAAPGERGERAKEGARAVCKPRAPQAVPGGSASSSEHTAPAPGWERSPRRGTAKGLGGSPAVRPGGSLERADLGCGVSWSPSSWMEPRAQRASWAQRVQAQAVPAGVQISPRAVLWLAQCVLPKQCPGSRAGTRAPPCCLCALPALPEGVPCPIWQRGARQERAHFPAALSG